MHNWNEQISIYDQEKSNWIDAIKIGTVASLLTRYTKCLGLLKRNWTPKYLKHQKESGMGANIAIALPKKGYSVLSGF